MEVSEPGYELDLSFSSDQSMTQAPEISVLWAPVSMFNGRYKEQRCIQPDSRGVLFTHFWPLHLGSGMKKIG